MSDTPKVVGPEYLVPLVHRSLETIKVDARRKADSLPPRLKIPGSTKLLWLETDVIAWLKGCSTAPKEDPEPANKSLFKRRQRA